METAILIYRFERKGRWVAEKQPGHYFWMSQHHTNNMFRFLLWRHLNRLLLRVCQRLNGDYLIPKEYWSWSRVRVGTKLYNPGDLLSNLFWKWSDPDNLEEDASPVGLECNN